MRLELTLKLSMSAGLLFAPLLACSDDGGATETTANEESGDGDGDTTTGDGDGDPSTGDGDGDTGDGDGDPTTGDGDGDPTTGDGDGDTPGAPCTSSADCSDTEYCDFGGLDNIADCGVWGQEGSCTARPEACDAGGIGACGCEGAVALNACELQAQGEDWLEFGGCELGEPGTFRCGLEECDGATQMCTISYNDVAGPNEPLYFANCAPLPEGCAQGDCSCGEDGFSTCFDGGGFTVRLYPGG